MLPYFNKTRTIIIKAIAIRLILALLFNGIISLSAGDCSIPILDAGFNREQLRNYLEQEERIARITELAFPDINESQKAAWRMLLIGTVAVESNFLKQYSGKSKNGNGPYQIIGKTAYGVIHSYVSYPVKGADRVVKREELVLLFEKATKGRITWDEIADMDIDGLKSLCAYDHDFACLISLLVYKDVFERKGIYILPLRPEALARLWKTCYNTEHGAGTEQFFIERFMPIYAYLT